ncbi:MAG: phosphatidylserine/phosphatidylglycerophosphate/cardiolipin synthase family protein [Bacteriovorax sp.]|nr:phosphatidylserine/phosphatidylglycerophosphate/cardiolipin synthase family protein [Bacteriovorax sp.]
MKIVLIILVTTFAFSSCQNISSRKLASINNIFSEYQDLECSPEVKISCSGLFQVHEKEDIKIGLLINGEASLAARLKSLRDAKKSILIQALVFKADEIGNYIAKILVEKKKAGLDVRLIIDTFSNMDVATQNLFYELKLAGIEVEGYETAYLGWVNEVTPKDIKQPNKRFHDKLWLIDSHDEINRVAIVGGMNIANEYFRLGTTSEKIWRDQDFIVKGNIIDDMTTVFERNYKDQKDIKAKHWINTDKTWAIWRKTIGQKFRNKYLQIKGDKNIIKKITKIETDTANIEFSMFPSKSQFFQNRPRNAETYIQQIYKRSFAHAKNKIFLVNAYFIPNQELIDSLKYAAKNGSEVIIVTNSPETNDLPEMSYASRYTYKDLLSVNNDPNTLGSLKIYEWQGHQYGEGTIHAKFAVIDDHTVIGGSYNLDPRSEKLNSETILVFENEILAKKLSSFVINNDIRKSRLISTEEAATYFNPKNPPDALKLLFWNGIKGML